MKVASVVWEGTIIEREGEEVTAEEFDELQEAIEICLENLPFTKKLILLAKPQ